MTNRHRAAIELAPEFLLELVKSGDWHIKTQSDVPDDAVLVGAQYDNTRDIWLLAFSSDSLPEVAINTMLPILNPPTFTRIYDETAS